LFNQFGGHSQAAGMTFNYDQLENIQSQLNTMIFQQLKPSDFKTLINITQSIHLKSLSEDLVEEIDQLAQFVMKNQKPIFHVSGEPTQVRQIGRYKSQLKIQYKTEENKKNVIAHRFDEIGNDIKNN